MPAAASLGTFDETVKIAGVQRDVETRLFAVSDVLWPQTAEELGAANVVYRQPLNHVACA